VNRKSAAIAVLLGVPADWRAKYPSNALELLRDKRRGRFFPPAFIDSGFARWAFPAPRVPSLAHGTRFKLYRHALFPGGENLFRHLLYGVAGEQPYRRRHGLGYVAKLGLRHFAKLFEAVALGLGICFAFPAAAFSTA